MPNWRAWVGGINAWIVTIVGANKVLTIIDFRNPRVKSKEPTEKPFQEFVRLQGIMMSFLKATLFLRISEDGTNCSNRAR